MANRASTARDTRPRLNSSLDRSRRSHGRSTTFMTWAFFLLVSFVHLEGREDSKDSQGVADGTLSTCARAGAPWLG